MAVDHYCTLDDVNALVPQAPFNATSRPTADVVKGFIESTAKRIDAVVWDMGYTAPVTSGLQALAILRELNSWGALGLAQQVRATAVNVATTESNAGGKNVWLKLFEEGLECLRLPDGVSRTEPEAGVLRSSVQSDVDRFATNPTITRDQVL